MFVSFNLRTGKFVAFMNYRRFTNFKRFFSFFSSVAIKLSTNRLKFLVIGAREAISDSALPWFKADIVIL